jgi:hypothetical protein
MLAGRRDVEDALERLDTLTKEEISMTVARNLRITCDIDHNVKATKDGAQHLLSICLRANHHFVFVSQTATDEAKRSLLTDTFIIHCQS